MVSKHPKDAFKIRGSLVTAFLLLLFVVIAGKLFYLQVINGQRARQEAEQQHVIFQKLSPSRGEIKLVDKFTGETIPVAANTDKFLVYAVPPEIQSPASDAAKLARALSLEEKTVLADLSDKTKKYVVIKKQISDQEEQAIKDLNILGIYFDTESIRVYPQQNLLSQVLGFVGFKGDVRAGRYGLEGYFNKELTGTPGSLTEEKDTSGAWIFGSTRELVPAVDGVNLVLTIDKNIQFEAQNLLQATVLKNLADSGSIVVINPKTGAVLAMANYPDFNPNEYNKVADAQIFSNEAATGNFEPGSIFKGITMAAALDEGKITPDTTYVDTGEVTVDGYHIKNAEPGARGVQTMNQVLAFSLNTGAIFAKEQIGNQDFYSYVKKFGFGQPTDVELPETGGNLDGLKYNVQVNFDTASFGQGISVTPLQMIQAYDALANGGKMMRPYIVQSKIYPDGSVVNTQPSVVRQVVSQNTANTVTGMLVNVIESGFGKRAAVPGYYLAGKTGTAQIPRTDGKPGYQPNGNIGSFIGFGPVDDPQFLAMVRIDRPRTVQFAESTAAPAFGELAKFILDYYHIPPTLNVPAAK